MWLHRLGLFFVGFVLVDADFDVTTLLLKRKCEKNYIMYKYLGYRNKVSREQKNV